MRGNVVKTPKVSVIVPVHNAMPYLRKCLDSIAAQTLQDIEVLCVDDGSTDESPDVLAEYAARDNRFRILRQENAGGGTARNLGMSRARGKYLSFLDADDFFHPNLLKLASHRAEEANADIVIYRVRQYHQDTGRYTSVPGSYCRENLPSQQVFSAADMPDFLFNSFQNWPWNKLFSRAFIQKYDITFQELQRTNDMRFVCTALAEARRIALLDRALVYYRTNTAVSCQDTNYKAPMDFLEAFIGTRDELVKRGKFPLLEQSFSNWVLDGLITNLRSMQDRECLPMVYRAVRERGLAELKLTEHPEHYYYNPISRQILEEIIASETPPEMLFQTGRTQKAAAYAQRYGLRRLVRKLYGRCLERLRS